MNRISAASSVELNRRTLRALHRALRAGERTIVNGWQSAEVERTRHIVEVALATLERILGIGALPHIGEPNLDCRYGISLLQKTVPFISDGDIDNARDQAEAFTAELRRNWKL